VKCAIFGIPKEPGDIVLPTKSDVVKFYLWVRHDPKLTSSGREPNGDSNQ
jgi:hypothetical protein